MGYHCSDCNMSINDLICTECECVLENDFMHNEGRDIQISQCPECGKKIKSPQCCGQDMISD